MEFKEGQTGIFTLRGEIARVADGVVIVSFDDAIHSAGFRASDLDGKFEADKPKFVPGGIYRTRTGSLWQYVDPSLDSGRGTPYFITFGTAVQYSALSPLFEDAERIS